MRRHPQRFGKLRHALAELIPTPPGTVPNAHRVGAAMRRLWGRVLNGKKLMCSLYAGSNEWRVVATGQRVSEAARPQAPAATDSGGIDDWP